MTSSGYNLNPFPYFPSPSYNLPNSSLLNSTTHDPSSSNNNTTTTTTQTFNFHQPHQDPVSFLAPYLPIAHFSTPEAAINFAVSGNNIHAFGNIPTAPRMGTGKKDRHSKIYTAQGLRDRRVRLSIDIARKFFDLQDMLGYDKASKTLEWLLGKSKKAIKELSNTKTMSLLANSSDFEQEEGCGLKMKSMFTIDHDQDQDHHEKAVSNNNKVEVFNLLAKESRDKARARARERTMEKKQLDVVGNRGDRNHEVSEHWSKHNLDQSSETPNLSMAGESSFMEKRKIYAKKFIDEDGVKPCREAEADAGISQWKLLDKMKDSKGGHLQEPSMMKRKWRPSIISGSNYERNLLISVDGIPINLTQNWDTNSNPNYPFPK